MQRLKKEEEERLRKKQEKAQKSSGKIKHKNTKDPKSDAIKAGKSIRKKKTVRKKVQIIESDSVLKWSWKTNLKRLSLKL